MHILHTEASTGWGGQEMRILRESIGMRERGHSVFFVVVTGGQLAERARKEGFTVYEFPMTKWHALATLCKLIGVIRKHHIDIVNTHSSFDAWWGGVAARLTGAKVLRTRHLSTSIRGGLNSYLLYRGLADHTVTTCESTAKMIQQQARLSIERCCSIPTGIEPRRLQIEESDRLQFRSKYGIAKDDCVVGTACILRSWKGLVDLIQAAKLLEHTPGLKWLIVGSGSMDNLCQEECKRLNMEDKVIFTGHLDNPYIAMDAMDVFMLLSTANEGVSQATLQAAYMEKPLITTNIGGLPEVCVQNETGFVVNVKSPKEVADKALLLVQDVKLRRLMGKKARQLVLDKFTMEKTLDDMEAIYNKKFS